MNQIAIVTGAGSGIGKGCAAALLAEGWSVAFAGRRIETLNAAVAEQGEHAKRALAVACDVSDEASVDALFETVRSRFGRIDLLFNNAGISLPPKSPDEVGGDAWCQAVGTNLNGAFYCLAAAFRHMRSQQPMGGRIINNGSISAHAPRPGSIAYTATKHAVSGLTRAAALDGRAFDIAVGQIDIGNVASDMTERMAKGVPQANGTVAPEPVFDPEHCGSAIRYMASLPLDTNVLTMTIKATAMPFEGRG